MIKTLFQVIDSKDAAGFAGLFAEECRFRFGNLPEVQGRQNIRNFVQGFFDSVQGLSHEVREQWHVPGGLVYHGMVTYTRLDNSQLAVPFAVIISADSVGIREYLVFADTSGLYG